MSWNYRIIKYETEGLDPWYAIHETYYDEDGKVLGFTENPTAPVGDSKKEVLETLKQMMQDVVHHWNKEDIPYD